MAELKQHALLLSIILILVIAKFVIVPVFAWQDEILSDITLLDKKQDKITSVLGQQNENKINNEQLNVLISDADKMFFPYQQESAFKLSQQKMLESLLSTHKLKSQNIGWQASTLLEGLTATRYSIMIRFSGQTADAIRFMGALESQVRRIEIKDFNVSLKGQRAENLGQVNGQVILYLYVNNMEQKNSVSSPAGVTG